jgi:uncharacterized protein YbaP (TraB family)
MYPLNKISWFLLSLTLMSSCEFLTKKDTPKSSMLWKIERDDLEHPTYVLGTMHLINKEYFYFPKELENLVLSSEQLIMELEGLPNATEAAKLMRLPDSVQLSDYFSEEKMALLYGFAEKEMKMNKQAFDLTFGRMKPFVLIQLITQKQFDGPTESFELTLMNLAEENKIKTIGLESIEQQIGFFDAIPMQSLADIITTYFEESHSLKQETKKMQVIYRAGNLDSLADFMMNTSPELLEFEDILLTNRNIAWVPKIMDVIYKKPSFIAVGAAHLTGENGLIKLLRKEGFKLTPVAF